MLSFFTDKIKNCKRISKQKAYFCILNKKGFS